MSDATQAIGGPAYIYDEQGNQYAVRKVGLDTLSKLLEHCKAEPLRKLASVKREVDDESVVKILTDRAWDEYSAKKVDEKDLQVQLSNVDGLVFLMKCLVRTSVDTQPNEEQLASIMQVIGITGLNKIMKDAVGQLSKMMGSKEPTTSSLPGKRKKAGRR